MLRSWSRGNYFRVGGENQIKVEIQHFKVFTLMEIGTGIRKIRGKERGFFEVLKQNKKSQY